MLYASLRSRPMVEMICTLSPSGPKKTCVAAAVLSRAARLPGRAMIAIFLSKLQRSNDIM
jgi:hypothetical protein